MGTIPPADPAPPKERPAERQPGRDGVPPDEHIPPAPTEEPTDPRS